MGTIIAGSGSTLEELNHLGVGFVSLTEALDLTTPTGRAMAGLLSVFAAFEHEILRERVRAGWSKPDRTANTAAVRQRQQSSQRRFGSCHRAGVSKAEIARRLNSAERRYDAFWIQNDEEATQGSCPGGQDPREDSSTPDLTNRPRGGTTIRRTRSAFLSRPDASPRGLPRRSPRRGTSKCSAWLRRMPA